MLRDIIAVVLAGGFGTRLRSAVADRPKVLAAVAGRPFLAYLLDQLAAAGVRRTVICTGYLGEMVEQICGARHGNLEVAYSRETTPLGTGGALRAALPLFDTPTILVLNGDSYCRTNLAAFAERHVNTGAIASLLLTQVDDTSRYGRVETDGQGRVVQFVEKGTHAGPGWINAGVYLLARRLLEALPAEQTISLEREVFPAWIGRGLFGHRDGEAFLDIGTPDTYAAAAEFLRINSASDRG